MRGGGGILLGGVRMQFDETGLVSDSDGMFSCGGSISCSDNWGFDGRGGGGGMPCGGLKLLTSVPSTED